jgi:hypothetical protein
MNRQPLALLLRFVQLLTLSGLQLFAGQVAYGSNWSFLKGAAIERFDDEDVRLLMATADEVVADPTTPATRQWKNDKTGHYGELRTLSEFSGPNNVRCKRLRVTNHADTRESKAVYTLCNMPPEGWRLVPSDFATPPKK